MKTILALLLLVLPVSAAAQDPMTAAEFESYVTGKTLYFAQAGTEYGVEEYLPGRRVRWSFLDGRCQDGYWYEANGLICFVYETGPDAPQCWRFYEGEDGLTARFRDDPAQTTLYEARQSDEPMMCLGPDVGV